MVVGGEAVIYYGHVRVTGDVDFLYEISEANARNLFGALEDFWRGKVPGVREAAEFLTPGLIVQFGVPPNRIDLINRITGVDFAEAWPNRLEVHIAACSGDIILWYLGLADLVRNKRAAGRPKDMDDLAFLERLPQ